MAIRQEQIVLLGASLLLGYMVFTSDSGSAGRRRTKVQTPEFEDHFAPDVSLAMARERHPGDYQRELFSVPTDTRPFPMLAFKTPLLAPLDALRPPPVAGPEARLYGQFLRGPLEHDELQGLFLETEEPDEETVTEEFALGSEINVDELTVGERQALIASYELKYDWVNFGVIHYGYIRNSDKFKLAQQPETAIEFVEVDPVTGIENGPSPGAVISIVRERVSEFGLADTIENRMELERLRFDGDLTQGQYMPVLEFANEAFEQRFESDRALEVAAEMYGRAAELTEDDPGARLGLASCAEAGYRFEEAFVIYMGLVNGRFDSHPLVLAQLASLEARFRMTDRAREHFVLAESYGRTSWFVQWKFGKFLLDLGETVEALRHLEEAVKFVPNAAGYQVTRASIRTDMAEALAATGDLDGAAAMFERALQADANSQRALAGSMGIGYLTSDSQAPTDGGLAGADSTDANFDLLMAQGLLALQAGQHEAAMERLQLAATADPLRAYLPWRALSYLAEKTSNAAEALSFADRAQANNPTDVYSLYQRGRVLEQLGDLEGAMESWIAALDLELDLPDALAAIGRLEMEAGNHERAERYLARATQVDNRLTAAFTTRGLNALHMDRAAQALPFFEEALAQVAADPVASIGKAWCVYSLGDPTEAKTLLREFEDSRRNLGEEDIYRVYATAQIERIGDWEEKVVWVDRFERQDIRNGWIFDEVPDVRISAREGMVVMDGTYDRSGKVRLKRTYSAGDFVSLEAKLTIREGTVRAGIFVGMESRRGARSTNQMTAEVSVSRHGIEKRAQYCSVRRNQDKEYTDVDVMAWEDNQTVRLKLERHGESGQTAFRVYIDGVLVTDRLPAGAMGQTTREIVVGIYTEGEPGRRVLLEIDDVEIVKRQR